MTPQEYEAKIKIYQDALTDVMDKLRDKRSELDELSRKTVQSLNTSIPELEKRVKDRQDTLKQLDNAISDRYAQLAKKSEDYQKMYEQRRDSLLKEVEDIKYALKVREEEIIARENQMIKFKKELDEREVGIANTLESLKQDREILNNERAVFIAEAKSRIDAINEQKSQAEDMLREAKQASGEAISRLSEVKSKEKVVEGREKQAQAILDRISEAQVILAEANSIANKNIEDVEKMRQESIRQSIEAKRLRDLNIELKNKEKLLIERENNVKILEGQISDKG